MKKLIVLLLCLTLAGCAGHANYYKNGITLEELKQDLCECTQQANLIARGNKSLAKKLMDKCFRAKGYVRQ
jgi:hypothetical protein